MLKIENLYGSYGKTPVLKDIDLEVEDGKVTALIGLNGSGKTTTINHVINLMEKTEGFITLDGLDSINNYYEYQAKVTYIPETPIIYEDLTLDEHIKTVVDANNLVDKKEQIADLLKKFRLEDKLNWFPIDFSKGMKQKVMIIMSLITDAKLFVIDEPFLGLDPLAVDDLISEIKRLKQNKKNILLSTHITSRAEEFVDEFVLIDKGEILAKGSIKNILSKLKVKSIDQLYLKLARESDNG